MESQALETGTSLKTVEASATQRGETTGFSPTRLARMHDALLRHVDSGRLPGLVASSAGGARSTSTLSVPWRLTAQRRCDAIRFSAWLR